MLEEIKNFHTKKIEFMLKQKELKESISKSIKNYSINSRKFTGESRVIRNVYSKTMRICLKRRILIS